MDKEIAPTNRKQTLKLVAAFAAGLLICVVVVLSLRLLPSPAPSASTPTPALTPGVTGTATAGPDATPTSQPEASVTGASETPAVSATPAAPTAKPTAGFVPDYLPGEINTRGNTNANLGGGGHVASQGSWIYFPVPTSNTDTDLYKARTDGTGLKKLTTDKTYFVNVIGDWIYYTNASDGMKLYRIRTDGSLRSKVLDETVNEINVVGDWIYYSSITSGTTGFLCKVHLDGTTRTVLDTDRPSFINVVGSWIFYCNDSDGGRAYRIGTDGNGKSQVVAGGGESTWWMNVVIDATRHTWIYYSGPGTSKIYKIKTDANAPVSFLTRTSVGAATGYGLIIIGDWIYYNEASAAESGYLYKVSLDGSQRIRLNTTKESLFPCIFGDWIYYQLEADKCIYRVRTDGTGQEKFGP